MLHKVRECSFAQDVSSLNLAAFSEVAFFLFDGVHSRLRTYMSPMSLSKHPPAAPACQMMAELAWASWETVMRRAVMIAQSTCSAAKYQRLLDEKTAAALEICDLLLSSTGASAEAFLTPWHSRATANAKRLRDE